VLAALLLVAACSGAGGGAPPATTWPATNETAVRDYWPTAGWRITAPNEQGMNPEVLAGIDALVTGHGALANQRRERFPQVRSVLVVRHGYLVYERYWHGDTATSGQEVASVTKSLTSTLVGIALGTHDLKSLDQTVGELLGRHLPSGADPRLAKVTVAQLLTMTSGLARDLPGAGGDPGLSEQMVASRDWVREILGRRLATEPGTSFAYSNAGPHLLSAMWPTPVASPPWPSPAPSCSTPLASTAGTRPSRCSRRRQRPACGPTSRPAWAGPRTPRATSWASTG
jgi:CubicO group peptidase (beta-lactamase class C family)